MSRESPHTSDLAKRRCQREQLVLRKMRRKTIDVDVRGLMTVFEPMHFLVLVLLFLHRQRIAQLMLVVLVSLVLVHRVKVLLMYGPTLVGRRLGLLLLGMFGLVRRECRGEWPELALEVDLRERDGLLCRCGWELG